MLDWFPSDIRDKGRVVSLEAGERLFGIGSRPQAMYLVLDGEIHLVRHLTSGTVVVLQRSRRGFIAEASLDQPAYHCDAVAVRLSQVLALSTAVFNSALADAAFGRLWIEHLARELRRTRAQAERLRLRSAEERIIHAIECDGEEGRLKLAGSRKDMAAELGLTHEAFYRALARMEAKGQIVVAGRELRLK